MEKKKVGVIFGGKSTENEVSKLSAKSVLSQIDKEKFVESFVRRFSQNVSNSRTYDIRFYDINETPPKVSVLVESETAASVNGESLSLSNKVDVILESNYYDNKYVSDMTRAGKLDYSDVDK